VPWQDAAWWFVPLLLLAIRPLSVALGIRGAGASRSQRWLIGWFGIRGVGSLYYLMYALNHGLSGSLADQLVGLTLAGGGGVDRGARRVGHAHDGGLRAPDAPPGFVKQKQGSYTGAESGLTALRWQLPKVKRDLKAFANHRTIMKKQAPDAIDLLDADHLAVHALFLAYGELARTRASALQRRALAEEICMELTIHAKLEEELFYPAVREALGDDDLLDEAEDQHGSQREFVAQILAGKAEDPLYDARMAALAEYVDAHVRQEREQVFNRVHASRLDLQSLARSLPSERKSCERCPRPCGRTRWHPRLPEPRRTAVLCPTWFDSGRRQGQGLPSLK
jgi:hemerythrin superfamily protein